MPIREVNMDKLEACEDLPEAPRKKRSVILSIIGIILLVLDIIGMSLIKYVFGLAASAEISVRIIKAILDLGCIASLVLLFVALKNHRKNKPFYIFLGLWAAYMVWFVIAMSSGIPFV